MTPAKMSPFRRTRTRLVQSVVAALRWCTFYRITAIYLVIAVTAILVLQISDIELRLGGCR
jgi:hypothetical protein